MNILPKFGTFIYDTNGVLIERWKDDETAKVPNADIARSNRGILIDGYLGKRTITIDGNIVGDTLDQLQSRVDSLNSAHFPKYQKLYKYDNRWIKAIPVATTIGDDRGLLVIPFSIRFEAANPFYYSETKTTLAGTIATNKWTSALVANTDAYSYAPIVIATLLATANQNVDISFTLQTNTGTVVDGITCNFTPTTTGIYVLTIDCAERQTLDNTGKKTVKLFKSGHYFEIPNDSAQYKIIVSPTGATLTSVNCTYHKLYI
jgi:hypothetical protein